MPADCMPTLCRYRPPAERLWQLRFHGASQPCCRRMQRMLGGAQSTGATAASESNTTQAVQSDFVKLANELADVAAKVTTQYFRSPVIIETKGDRSPVTEADRQAEANMTALIQKHCPSHSIFGEEQGMHQPEGGDKRYLWILDPIDGTKAFITGKPTFGTLIALLFEGRPVLGILDQPISHERWVGVQGQGTTLNGRRICTRDCGDISLAYLDSTSPHIFDDSTEPAFVRVRDAVRTPLYGSDCYAYGLLAAGFVDLVVEANLKVYDYMPLVPIIKGAGGLITDWEGSELEWRLTAAGEYSIASLPGEVIAAGSATVHQQALKKLAWSSSK